MKWLRKLWRRRPKVDPRPALSAINDAERALHAVREQGKEVREVAASIREHRTRNHFAERLEAALRRTAP